MKSLRAITNWFGVTLTVACVVTGVLGGAAAAYQSQPVLGAVDVPIMRVDDLEFKDLNKNGALDPYEDWRLTPEERVEDLLSRMTLEEKTAQMIHFTLFRPQEEMITKYNFGFALAYQQLQESPRAAAEWANRIQSWCEASTHGIPMIISMDSAMGASWVRGAALYPDQIGLAATRDPSLVRRLAAMQREEMIAVGVRMSLSPIADLGTEPRWGRFQETFGEHVELASEMVAAAVEGLQNGTGLNPKSVLACVKHFPGSGAQENGVDGSPILLRDETLDMHLQPFKRAMEAGAWAIMPYGYSTVPCLGGDAVERTAHESKAVMTDLLRNQLGFEGIIQTDWGMNHVDAALAGADALGGADIRYVSRLAESVPEEQINQSVRRILLAKFQMGLFEDPYVDPDEAEHILGNPKHAELAFEAAARSLTLLKNDGLLPIAGANRIVVAGPRADDLEALNSGWKSPGHPGITIAEALEERAREGGLAVERIPQGQMPTADTFREGDVAVVVLGEGTYTHEPEWRANVLDVPEEQVALVEAAHNSGVPVVTVVILGRPYVLTSVVAASDAVLVAYRPGVTQGAKAVAGALFGDHPVNGSLPFQLPRSIEQIAAQREDLPGDIADPLFDAGAGISLNP